MGSRTEAGAKCLSGGACVPESVIQSWRPDLRLVSAAAPLAPRAALRSPDQSGPTLPEARYPIAPQPRAPEAHKSPERRTPPHTGRSGDAVLCAASSAKRDACVYPPQAGPVPSNVEAAQSRESRWRGGTPCWIRTDCATAATGPPLWDSVSRQHSALTPAGRGVTVLRWYWHVGRAYPSPPPG